MTHLSPVAALAGRGNRRVHLVALSLTKIADGLIDPKLVLSWLLTTLGSPGAFIGALVPVREAGALLPQLALARWIQSVRRRKIFWAAGSALQGLSALGIGLAALTMDGVAAGWAIVACLAVFACARAACSASHKDVLARTVEKGQRGTVSGQASSAGAMVVLGFAVLLGLGVIPLTIEAISLAVLGAGGLWLIAALVFLGLDEPEAGTGKNENIFAQLAAPLRDDEVFRQYLATRALLISTALAPPFLVMLSNSPAETGLGNLGLLMLASAGATILSARIWGGLSDRSSRLTLIMAGSVSGVTLGAASAMGIATGSLGGGVGAAVFVFLAQIGYEGARAGRKTYLTDMDTGEQKPVYTALSNSLIGILLVAGGGFGLLADYAGPAIVLAVFAGLALAGAMVATGLADVQKDD